jgi:two-component system nitrate/nitrite response regulator NarL
VALLPDATQAADAWAAGARGLLLRSADAPHLLTAIKAVGQGLAVLDPALAGALPLDRPRPPTDDLTPRERDVLRLLAEGLSNKGIAQRLSISDHTVKFHLNAILSKLNAQSRTEAVVTAIRLGLIAV